MSASAIPAASFLLSESRRVFIVFSTEVKGTGWCVSVVADVQRVINVRSSTGRTANDSVDCGLVTKNLAELVHGAFDLPVATS